MKTGDFFFLIFLWAIFQFTPYRQKATLILFALIAFNVMSHVNMYIPRKLENYTEGDIQPGNVVSTFAYLVKDPLYMLERHVTALVNGYSYFHTALAVSHKGKTYMLHAYTAFEAVRGNSPYLNQIEKLVDNGKWTIILEPLECFLYHERQTESYLRILDTGKSVIYEVCPDLENRKVVHCCYHLARYMEKLGLCENSTGLSDLFYYSPQQFFDRFKYKKDVKLI